MVAIMPPVIPPADEPISFDAPYGVYCDHARRTCCPSVAWPRSAGKRSRLCARDEVRKDGSVGDELSNLCSTSHEQRTTVRLLWSHIRRPERRRDGGGQAMRDAIAMVAIAVAIVIASFLFVSYVDRTEPLTGKVTKLWTQGSFYRYAVVETHDGKRQSVSVGPQDFILLEVGSTCTFQVRHNGEATAVTCEVAR